MTRLPKLTLRWHLSRQLYDWDWTGGEKEFQRAIELNPNYAVAHHIVRHALMADGTA